MLSSVLDELGYKRINWFVAPSLIHSKYHWIKRLTRTTFKGYKCTVIGTDVLVNVRKSYLRRKIRKVRNGEYILGHTALEPWLKNELRINGFQIINVVRDPIDVLYSNIHHLRTRNDHFLYKYICNWPQNKIADLYLDGGIVGEYKIRPMSLYYEAFLKSSNNTLLVDFADIVNGTKQFEKLVSHININDKQIRKEDFWGKGNTFRTGKIGGGKSNLPREQINKLRNGINYTYGSHDKF